MDGRVGAQAWVGRSNANDIGCWDAFSRLSPNVEYMAGVLRVLDHFDSIDYLVHQSDPLVSLTGGLNSQFAKLLTHPGCNRK